jgi:hypothetical protein
VRKNTKRALVAVAGSGVGLFLGATPAFAQSITAPTGTPASPFIVPECTSTTNCDNIYGVSDVGVPVAFPVTGTGWAQGTTVSIEICDGKSPTAQGWTPGIDCDSTSSPAGELIGASNPQGNVSWGTGNPNNEIGDFRGESLDDLFNCLAPGDNPNSTMTLDGEPIDPGKPSWTNCQLRMATSVANSTPDQQFVTMQIPNSPSSQVPEAPMAILLPLGALGLLGGGVVLTRRRRHARAAA